MAATNASGSDGSFAAMAVSLAPSSSVVSSFASAADFDSWAAAAVLITTSTSRPMIRWVVPRGRVSMGVTFVRGLKTGRFLSPPRTRRQCFPGDGGGGHSGPPRRTPPGAARRAIREASGRILPDEQRVLVVELRGPAEASAPRNDRIAPTTPRTAAMTARPSRIGPTTAPCTSDIVVVGPLRRAGEQTVDALHLHGGETRGVLQVFGHARQALRQRPDLALDPDRHRVDTLRAAGARRPGSRSGRRP